MYVYAYLCVHNIHGYTYKDSIKYAYVSYVYAHIPNCFTIQAVKKWVKHSEEESSLTQQDQWAGPKHSLFVYLSIKFSCLLCKQNALAPESLCWCCMLWPWGSWPSVWLVEFKGAATRASHEFLQSQVVCYQWVVLPTVRTGARALQQRWQSRRIKNCKNGRDLSW